MQDIVYMENVLFFYALGELDSLYNEIAKSDSNVKREELTILKTEINDFRKTAFFAERDESDVSVFQNIADRTNEIVSDLHSISNKLGIQGNALKVITDELGRLATKTTQLINDYEESVTDGEGSNSI
jgi:archaellum component FlaC